MRLSREAAGVEINEEVVKSFTALEFVGNTSRTNIQLDTVCKITAHFAKGRRANECLFSVQDLLRINRDINSAPLYHTLYWNCHDIAIRFALLAMTGNNEVVQTLARQFENAKLNARYQQEFATHFGLPWVGSLINNAGSGALLSGGTLGSIGGISPGALGFPVTSSFMLGIMANRISRNLPTAFQVYELNVRDQRAIRTRCESLVFLENSFPRLRGLGLGSERWQDIANSAGRISQLLLPALRAALLA
jgi:hypothetical protein